MPPVESAPFSVTPKQASASHWAFLVLAAVAALSAAMNPAIGWSQDAADPAATDLPPVQAPPDEQERQLNEMAAAGSTDLADALAAFARIKRWGDADRWIKQGIGPINNPAELAKIANRIGSDNLLKLSFADQVSPEAKAILAKLGKAARAVAESKPILMAAINDLDSPSSDKRLASTRRLFSGGKASVAALVEAAVSDQPSAYHKTISFARC